MSVRGLRYLHTDAPHDAELARLRLLEARHDPETIRRLDLAGPLEGSRCLEVGAGAGSIACFLADAVGPGGEVIALDRDPRFLADLPTTFVNAHVHQHDIAIDPLEAGTFDLVHCRALLLHLADPERALAAMAAALRPGGWLLVEDADYSSLRAGDPEHPAAARFDAVIRAVVNGFLARADMDPYFGRTLATLVGRLGLEAGGGEALEFRRFGGTPEALFLARSVEGSRGAIIGGGTATAAEIEDLIAALLDPTFAFVDPLNVAAWGRRPMPSFVG